jgi:streptogramin lyase
LFQRGRSNDAAVANVIRNGGATMPGFDHSLSNADVSDLLSYLKSTACCYEANDPPVNPQYLAAAHQWPVPGGLRGGAHGRVLASDGSLLEGIKVQLIAPNGVRATVSTNAGGVFEFPVMQAGEYRLRIATPLTFEPYQRNRVRIAQDNSIDDIVLREVSQPAPGALPGALPASEEMSAQLSGAELLWNLSGSLYEKTAFMRTCGIGCHDLKQILRNRFDERGWRSIVTWMTSRGSASVFVVRPTIPVLTPDAERVVQWLTRVRGPESRDDPYRAFPRPTGPATDVVITEYELPHRFLSIHEVDADSKGHIWYTSHRTPYVGQLDPRTGIVTDYKVPDIPGMFPGTYKVAVDRNKNRVWFSQNWAHRLTQLDPATGRFKQLLINIRGPFNAGPWGNFGLAPDGTIWSEYDDNSIVQLDGTSGTILKRYPLSRNPNPADDLISTDGRYWAGGAPTMGNNTGMILDIRSGTMYETNSGGLPSSAARGGFDRNGNAWFGGHTGSFVEIVNEIDRGKSIHMRTFTPPTPYFPYSTFYSAMPDASGNIWGAWVHGRGFVRLDPGAGTWRVYDNPEPSAFARSTWVDNSTSPATVWYPDYQMGTLVRIQPRD